MTVKLVGVTNDGSSYTGRDGKDNNTSKGTVYKVAMTT